MQRIKEFRIKKNLSIYELASMTDLTPSYISNLERGVKVNPSKEVMEKIARALDATVPEVFYSGGNGK